MSTDSIKEILMLCEEFIPGDSGDPAEFFFDKVRGLRGLELIFPTQNPENFASVLEMYRSGKFHIPDGGRGRVVV